jgi:eukaryotic-like serine/threonine-protein kinase
MRNLMRLAMSAELQATSPAPMKRAAPVAMEPASPAPIGIAVGRYVVYAAIASGGMATVHVGRVKGPAGFSRTVAIKRLHPQFAGDPAFVNMMIDEARLTARVQHPNVVSVVDVVQTAGELYLVMDFIRGESLSKLARARRARHEAVPEDVSVAIMSNVLHGLHAAHEVRDEAGHSLELVHRDVSPQNVLVGVDGVARLLDFGIAKAGDRVQTTRSGELKGKLDYMAPEQFEQRAVSRRADIYAASVVLWEILAGRRLLEGDDVGPKLMQISKGGFPPPSSCNPRLGTTLDAIVLRGLSRDPEERFETARQMAIELERAALPATASRVGEWVTATAERSLAHRDRLIAEVESMSQRAACLPVAPPAGGTNDTVEVEWSSPPPSGGHSEIRMQSASDLSSQARATLPDRVARAVVAEVVPRPEAKKHRSGQIGAVGGFALAVLLGLALVRLRARAERAPLPSAPAVQMVANTPPEPASPPPEPAIATPPTEPAPAVAPAVSTVPVTKVRPRTRKASSPPAAGPRPASGSDFGI